MKIDIDRYTTLRRRLHSIPELGYEEHETAAVIREELSKLGIEHLPGVEGAPTATVALLGNPNKPCVALRADIDALPIVERTGVPYASRNEGRMHACGHDGHVATLLAAAAALRNVREELPVCVKLLFQPAEEGGAGGRTLTEAGVLDGRIGPKVSAIFGLHGWPGLPVGTVATCPGPILAATDTFEVTFVGKGGHGAFPHWCRDPVVPACEAVLNLQQIASRDSDPTDPVVVTVGMIHAGTATNVIPDEATLCGTARTLRPETRRLVLEAIERRCRAIASSAGCEARVKHEEGYPATINDPAMAAFVAETARAILGTDRFLLADRPSMGGEDFAYYLEKVSGCFFMVGLIPHGRRDYPALHSDHFDFNDDAIAPGATMFIELVRRFRPASTR
jgi:amidohydrolase